MPKITIYTYRCSNSECRSIQHQSRQRRSQMPCEVCGKRAVLIGTSKEG